MIPAEMGGEVHIEDVTPRYDLKAAAAQSVAEDEKHKEILEMIAINQSRNEEAAAAANAKILQEMAEAKANVAAHEEALSTIIMGNRRTSKMDFMARLSPDDHENGTTGRIPPTRSVNDDNYDERGRSIDLRRQRDYSRAQSVPPPSNLNLNRHGELDCQSRFVDDRLLQPTASNTRGEESPLLFRSANPQDLPTMEQNGTNQHGVPPRSFVPTNSQPLNHPRPQRGIVPPWWQDEAHQAELRYLSSLPPTIEPPPWQSGPYSAFVSNTSPCGSPIEQSSIAGQQQQQQQQQQRPAENPNEGITNVVTM